MTPRPGDRVRITCEGVVTTSACETWPLVVKLDGSEHQEEAYTKAIVAAQTFKWEVIPRALEVGDRVATPGAKHGQIIAIHGDLAWVETMSDNDLYLISRLKPLEPSSPFQGQGKQGLSPASAEIAVAPQVVDPDGRRSDGGEEL
jgi:hypothetical protein